MTESTDHNELEAVVRAIDPLARLLRAWELKGGVSAQVTAIEIERPDGRTEKMVIRRHGDADLKRNPRIAADEFKLLKALQSVGVSAPAPRHLDESGKIFSKPYLVIEHIDAEPDFASSDLNDLVLQLTKYLVDVHRVDLARVDLSFLPKQADIIADKLEHRPTRVDESVREGQIRDILGSVWPLPRRNERALLHGDYWPGNILWKDGRLAAVIDWEDAAIGDPSADVANCRLEILWAFGADAMLDFTHGYDTLAPLDFTHLPYWDLCAALITGSKIAGWTDDEATERSMRQAHRSFVAQALEKLSV